MNVIIEALSSHNSILTTAIISGLVATAVGLMIAAVRKKKAGLGFIAILTMIAARVAIDPLQRINPDHFLFIDPFPTFTSPTVSRSARYPTILNLRERVNELETEAEIKYNRIRELEKKLGITIENYYAETKR